MTAILRHSKQMLIPGTKRQAWFYKRSEMKAGHPTVNFALPSPAALHEHSLGAAPVVPPGPIDWTKNGAIQMPIDGNAAYGDCEVAAAEHWDNCATGCAAPPQSTYTDTATDPWYLALSGGDNGLSNGQMIAGWKAGLPGIPAATISDALSIDPTNAALVRTAMYLFGPVLFQLACPDTWVSAFVPTGGAVWGPPAVADENNGHAVLWAAIDATGRYRTPTWGSYTWMVPAAVSTVDPTAFIVFSRRWFNPAGFAPNGQHISVAAPLWVASGGSSAVLALVALYPPATGPTPPPVVPPVVPPAPPARSVVTLTGLDPAGAYALVPTAALDRLAAAEAVLAGALGELGLKAPAAVPGEAKK